MSDIDLERQCWIELPDADTVRSARPEGHPYDFGFASGMSRLLAAHPQIGPAFMQLFAAVMFAPGNLDRQEREMIAAVAASAQGCFY